MHNFRTHFAAVYKVKRSVKCSFLVYWSTVVVRNKLFAAAEADAHQMRLM